MPNTYWLEYPNNSQRLWCKEIDNKLPNRETIKLVMSKLEQTGFALNVDLPDRGQFLLLIKYKRWGFLDFDNRTSKVNRLNDFTVMDVSESIRYKSFILRLVHELNEDDYDRRLEFCGTFVSLLDSELILFLALYGCTRQYSNPTYT